MYNEQIESLIKAALIDGVLTEKEKQILFKKAESMGIDLDEFEMVLDARLVELQKAEKEKAEKSAPKSNKYGDVRKCPSCGAILPALSGSCPECGCEFSCIGANLSFKKLADLLVNEQSKSKRELIIRTFPIPNTKDDLFEFIISMRADVLDDESGLHTNSIYYEKYVECLGKVKVLFPNDERFVSFLKEFEEAKQKKIISETKNYIELSSMYIGMFIGIGTFFLIAYEHNWNWLGWIGAFYAGGFAGIGIGIGLGKIIGEIIYSIRKRKL